MWNRGERHFPPCFHKDEMIIIHTYIHICILFYFFPLAFPCGFRPSLTSTIGFGTGCCPPTPSTQGDGTHGRRGGLAPGSGKPQ